MKSAWSVLKLALTAAIWRTSRDPRFVGLPSLLAWIAVLAMLRMALQFAEAGPGVSINPYGLNSVIAWGALDVAVAALFVPPPARTTALAAMLVLTVFADVADFALKPLLVLIPVFAGADPAWRDQVAAIAAFALVSVWWIVAVAAVLRSVTSQITTSLIPWASFARAAGIWIALLAVSALLPHAPFFVGRNFDVRSANLWEILHAQLTASQQDAAASGVDKAQATLLQTQIANLAPPTKGTPAVYALGLAGWAGQDVFLKELDGGLAALAAVLPIQGRSVRLVNSSETLASLPLANQRNFAAAVQAIAAIMNKDEDILLLLMTSHGIQTAFGLRLPNETVVELTPQDVATVLDNAHIKNRVVIVSACYAGIFVPPLANDNTIVLAAADAQHTSFGCAPERDWTYFGDAFFRQSLRPGWDFQRAFDNARVLISGWEMMDRAVPSNPQAHFGPALVAKLKPIFAAVQSSGQ
jgi:hypothetical protein